MDLQLKDRTVLMTGGSKGIDGNILRQLFKVIFCTRPSPDMAALETQLRATGGVCMAMSVDVFDVAVVDS